MENIQNRLLTPTFAIRLDRMAGLGRRTHYRKHLTDSILHDFPEPLGDERVAKIVATRGSNQFDIVLSVEKSLPEERSATTRPCHLAILPTKFRKLVWLKRNDFVIVQTATDAEGADRKNDSGGVRFMITHILYKEQIKHLQSNELWPGWDTEFTQDSIESSSQNEKTTNEDCSSAGVRSFDEEDQASPIEDGIVYATGYDTDDDLFVNTNRLASLQVQDSSETESDEN